MRFRTGLSCAILVTLAFADDESQKLEDEIQAVQLQKKTLVSIQEIEYLLAAARDHARPTDLAEKLIDQPKVGYFLRQAHNLAKGLTRGLDPVPPWLERYESAMGAIGKVRKFAAAAHALETMIVATMDAETSTGAEKLRQMGGLIKDVSALVKANPLLKQYASSMGSVVERMAESAVVIEAAKQKTNWAIKEADQAIVGTEYKEPGYYEHPLDPAIEEAERQLRELEKRLRALAYEEVEAAEAHCATRHGTSVREISRLRREAWQDMLALRKLARAQRMLRIRASELRELIPAFRGDVAVLRLRAKYPRTEKEARESEKRLIRTRGQLQILENELAELRATAVGQQSALVKRFKEIRTIYRRKQAQLRRFEDCVKGQLKDAEHADRHFLRDRFPQYARQRRSVSVKDPATLRVKATPPTEDPKWACLAPPRPARPGRARDFERNRRLSVAKGEAVSSQIVVPRGTEISARVEQIKGKAELRMYREARAESDLHGIDVNVQRIETLRSELQKTGRTWIFVHEPNLHIGPRQQRYMLRVKCTRGKHASCVLRVVCRNRGDLGLRTDAGSEDAPLPVLPLGRELVGYLSGNDTRDDFLIPYVAAHTRIRVTLKVNAVGVPDGRRAWQRIRLDRWSVICNAKGEQQSFRLQTMSNEDTLVRHGQRRFLEFITDRPGHFRIRLNRMYGGPHRYRIKAEILKPVRVERDGKLVGFLGQQQRGWYIKVPGVYAVRGGFKNEAAARKRLLETR